MVRTFKNSKRTKLFNLACIIVIVFLSITGIQSLDKNKIHKMDQFKKNFQFDLEQDDTILKDVQDITSSQQQKTNLNDDGEQTQNIDIEKFDLDLLNQDGISLNSQHTTNFKTSVCSIFDRCRVCSFKELQQMPECQETGFRLIKRCIKRDQTTGSIIEDKYENQSCEVFSGTLKEYKKEQEGTSAGQYAEPDTHPYSMAKFMVLMGMWVVIVTSYLNNRKDRILHEIYSKITIVSRK